MSRKFTKNAEQSQLVKWYRRHLLILLKGEALAAQQAAQRGVTHLWQGKSDVLTKTTFWPRFDRALSTPSG
jgi:hypothetical protein